MLNKNIEHNLIKEVKNNLIKSMQIRAEKLLNSLANMDTKNPNNQNNDSIVVRLAYGEVSFLFTADIERKRELLLIAKQKNKKVWGKSYLMSMF